MKWFVSIFFFFILVNVFSQDTTKTFYPSGQIKKQVIQRKLQNAISIVCIIKFYENGNREYFMDDTTQIKYYTDGQVYEISAIKDGKKSGVSKIFFDNKLTTETNYENNVQQGWTTTYDPTTGKKGNR